MHRLRFSRESFRAARALGAVAALGGTLASAPSAASAYPFFSELEDAFGEQPCAGLGCWTNYVRVTDIDGDTDLDVLLPNADGFFIQLGTKAEQPFAVYENDGLAGFTDVSATAVGGYANWLRQIAIGDVDGDHDPDIYAPSAWGDPDAFFINDGFGVFTDEAALRLPGVSSHAGATRFGDVDNDGDLDLLVGDGWATGAPVLAHLYLNDGAGVFTESLGALFPASNKDDPIDFDLFDADRDFDLDLLINMHTGPNSLWVNDGTGKFTDASAELAGPASGHLHYGPVPCDVDGDGDLDLWVDNIGEPDFGEQLLINDGTGKFTDETEPRMTDTDNIAGADDNGLACLDVDGDGDFDAAVMSLSNNERVLLNDGTGKFTLLENAFPIVDDATLWFDFGDLNGDGRLDVVTAQGESSTLEHAYLGNTNAPIDVRPPALLAVEQAQDVEPGATNVVRFAVSDTTTTDEGPRLERAYVTVTTSTNADSPAQFMGGDLFRATLPAQTAPGVVTYTACAIDRRGNSACSAPLTYLVGDGGASGTSGSGSSAGSGMTNGSGGSTGAVSQGESDDGVLDQDNGCGCEAPGTHRGQGGLRFGAGIAAALWLGRRRQSRPARRLAPQ